MDLQRDVEKLIRECQKQRGSHVTLRRLFPSAPDVKKRRQAIKEVFNKLSVVEREGVEYLSGANVYFVPVFKSHK